MSIAENNIIIILQNNCDGCTEN